MIVPKPVRAWVADAEATYGPTIDTWFPAEFDWRSLCADVPSMAERLGGTWKPATAAAAKARLDELAQSAFRGAHVAALAILAGYDAEVEPDDALARLAAPLSGAEQDALAGTLAEDVATVEGALGAPGGEAETGGGARAAAALRSARAVIEPVRALLAEGLESAARGVVALGASSAPMAKVLAGVVNVAVALAALRHALAAEVDAAEDREPLRLDAAALAAAFGSPASRD